MTIPRQERPLSPMEMAILIELAQGKRCKEIAKERGRTVKTIELHKYRLMRKLHIHTTADLIRLYGKTNQAGSRAGADAA